MECIFNELSAVPVAADPFAARKRMRVFVGMLTLLRKAGITIMRVRDDFHATELCVSYAIQNWLWDKTVDVDSRRRFVAFLRYPYIRNSDVEVEEAFIETEVEHAGVPAGEGMCVAALSNPYPRPLASFYTDALWRKSIVEVLCIRQVPGAQRIEKRVTVPHLSREWHVREHLSLISDMEFDEKPWRPTHSVPLPKAERCLLLVLGKWAKFVALLKRKPAEKIALIQTMAEKVALANCYEKNQHLSARNHQISGRLRHIYTFRLRDIWMHLSVDVEKGAFEVCRANGRHLGELGFDGTWNSGADGSGHHDIEV